MTGQVTLSKSIILEKHKCITSWKVSCFLAKQHSNSFSSSSRFGLVLHHCKRVISLICKYDILFVI